VKSGDPVRVPLGLNTREGVLVAPGPEMLGGWMVRVEGRLDPIWFGAEEIQLAEGSSA
jgi:hypothetical protein